MSSHIVAAQVPLNADVWDVPLFPSLSPGLAAGAFPNFEDSASALSSSGRCPYLPTQSQALYLSAIASPSARSSLACFDDINRKANVRAKMLPQGMPMFTRALSWTMTNANDNDNDDDDDNDNNFADALGAILGA